MHDKLSDKTWGQLTPNEVLEIYLLEGHAGLIKRVPLVGRPLMFLEGGLLKLLPSDPRCVWCSAPFRGVGAPFMRAIGKDKSKYNPSLCTDCENFVRQHNAGVEIEMSLVFADIRGSTTLAEGMNAAEFSQIINRFYSVASEILVREKAFIDKLAGDQVAAFFVPGLAGAEYHMRAIRAAKEILRATGHEDPNGPWVPVGVGVHSGLTYFGAVGKSEGLTDLTVLGDPPNTAARLASSAKAGEILISASIAEKAKLDTNGLEKRRLSLKGKSENVDVWVEQVGPNSQVAKQ